MVVLFEPDFIWSLWQEAYLLEILVERVGDQDLMNPNAGVCLLLDFSLYYQVNHVLFCTPKRLWVSWKPSWIGLSIGSEAQRSMWGSPASRLEPVFGLEPVGGC